MSRHPFCIKGLIYDGFRDQVKAGCPRHRDHVSVFLCDSFRLRKKGDEMRLLRPVLCCVVDAHDLDCFIVEAVNRDVGQRRNHQLASALDTSAAAKVGERSQVRDSTVESEYDISCRVRFILLDSPAYALQVFGRFG